ncbi:MAG: DUF5689 domain-containing protein [Rikenellaceae bacterium]
MARLIAYINLLLLLTACNNDSSGSQSSHGVVSIATLRNMETNNRSVLISDNLLIEGIVTANDKYNEFYNCLVIEDQSAAIKILCELEDGYKEYPFGAQLRVSCSGLYLINHYGSLKIGAEPSDEYTLDYIAQSRVGQYIKRLDDPTLIITPSEIDIEALTPLDTYRYIVLSEVLINNEEGTTTLCQRDSETGRTVDTSHTITDSKGDTIELFVDRLCTYADSELPTTTCTLHAIVDYYDEAYSLTITNCSYIAER